MRRSAMVVASVLLASLLLPGGSARAEWGAQGPRSLGAALSGGAYVFVPYLFVLQEVGAEVVVGDRVGIGGKAVFALGGGGGPILVPYVAVGTPRSRPSAGYLAIGWLPGSPAGRRHWVTRPRCAVPCVSTERPECSG
jgi:hypothetical protein